MAAPTAAAVRAFERVAGRAAADVAELPGPVLEALGPVVDEAMAAVAKGLEAWLLTVEDPSARYTAREYKTTLRFLRPAFAGINRMAASIATELVESAAASADLATQHLDQQLAAIGAARDAGPTAVGEAAQRALAKQHRANAAASMAGLVDDIRGVLAAGVVAKETIEQLVARLEALDPGARTESLAAGGWLSRIAAAIGRIARGIAARASAWVDRVVTTEVVDGYDQQFNDALRDAARAIPDLQRRWDASQDSATCPICSALHRQVRPLDEAFEAGDGSNRFDGPPAHPSCRCVVTVFRPGWS